MSFEVTVCSVLNPVLHDFGLSLAAEKIGGFDGKTGERLARLEFSSATKRLMVVREDGEINAMVWLPLSGQWKYVRTYGQPSERDVPIEELLKAVPTRPRSDREMLESLEPYIRRALGHE